MISFMIELFANIKLFGFYIKPSSGQLIRNVVSSELYLILFLKWNKKNEKTFNILFLLLTFCFKTMWHN